VFPLFAGSKKPAIDGWTTLASSDPDTVRGWWTEIDPVVGSEVSRPYNIGVLTTGMVVIDIDIKDNKPGMESAIRAGVDFDTLTVQTVSGGLHLYYSAPESKSGVDVLGPGVDIRAYNAYVVGPGSVIDGRAYKVMCEAPVAALSASLVAQVGKPHVRSVNTPTVELDTPVALEQARSYLMDSAPLAIEGQAGHNATYRVACRCRDIGLSESAVSELMLELWNGRCQPPWDEPELRTIVANAETYALNAAGSGSLQVNLGGVNTEVFGPDRSRVISIDGIPPAHEIPPRPWVVPRLLLRQQITLLVAEGSAGKSTLILILAAHMALGRDFLGFKVPRKWRSIIYNAEDDRDEMARRLYAICQAYKFDPAEVLEGVQILVSGETGLQLVQGNPPSMKTETVQQLVDMAGHSDIGMLALDPLIDIHSVNENDNTGMRYVMAVLRLIARQADVAVLVAHHTSRAGMNAEARAGDISISRGATTVSNAARIALTLSPPSTKDIDELGLREEDRSRYARLDDAKMNMSLVSGRPIWLKREGVRLINGDEVGVLIHYDADTAVRQDADLMAKAMLGELRRQGTARMPMSEAATALMNVDPLYAKLPIASVVTRLERALSGGVDIGDDHVTIGREQKSGKNLVFVTLD